MKVSKEAPYLALLGAAVFAICLFLFVQLGSLVENKYENCVVDASSTQMLRHTCRSGVYYTDIR